MSRRSTPTRRRAPARRRPARGRSQSRPSLFWGRALLTVVVLLVIWAQWRGQQP